MKRIILLTILTTIYNFGQSQISNTNAFLIGNSVEVGIDGAGGYEGADITIGTLPGIHFRTDPGNNGFGFVADPALSGWTNFDGDFFTPGSPENGWGFEVGAVKAGNNGSNGSGTPLVQIPGAITNWSNTAGCIQVDWAGASTGSGVDVSFGISYRLNVNDLFYTTDVTVTNDGATTLTNFYYYRNIDPDNNEVLNGSYSTTNTIVSQPVAGCSKALVSATQATPSLSYVGLAAIGPNFRVSHGGFTNRDGSDLWTGTGFNSNVGNTLFADEAISLSYLIPTLLPGESKTFKFLIILDASQADNALDQLFFFNYVGSIGSIPDCSPTNDTAFTCTSNPLLLSIDGTGTSDFNWVWTPSTGLSTTVGTQTFVTPTTTITYTVTGTPVSSCFTTTITKDITVNVLQGPDAYYIDPGNQCNTFDLSTLLVNDSNSIAGTVINFYSSPPSSADDTTNLLPSNIMNQGDSVWVSIGDTALGCFSVILVDIQWAPGFTMNFNINDANCGLSNGDATVTGVNGGVFPYTYQWLGGPSTPNYSGIGFGSYTVSVTDSLGCTIDTTIQINDVTTLAGTVDSVLNAECGLPTGNVNISGLLGNPSYQFDIGFGNQPTGTFNNLAEGSYNVIISDQDGCSFVVPVVVGADTTLSGTINLITNSECGLANGQIDLIGLAGGLGYSYDIGLGSQTSGIFTNIAPGSYIATITDSGGCTFDMPFVIVNDTTLSFSIITINDEVCNGSNGVIDIVGVNGSGPYTYDIGGPSQSTGLFTGLSAGPYTVTVTGAGGCSVDTTITLVSAPDPTLILSVTTIADENCSNSNGIIDVVAVGGTGPFDYDINGGPIQPTGLFTGLPAGTYTVTITAANGCVVDTIINILNVNDPLLSASILTANDENCGTNNGVIEIVGVNGTLPPYTYDIGGPSQATGLFTGLPAGSYTVTVTTSGGCTFDTLINLSIIPLSLDFGPDVVECHTVPLSIPGTGDYLWSTGETTQSITADESGVFWAVFSTNGGLCLASDTISITLFAESNIIVPNVFSPNGDGMNDEFRISGNFENYNIQIYNRWGAKVFESSDVNNHWNGGTSADGTYFYIIEYDDPCVEERQLVKGALSLLK